MAKIYKIHPAVGIMRVGDSSDAFFIGPETPGQPGVELNGGNETPITNYKANGRIKRQAARFRVFEYDQAGSGTQTLIREVTADDATIDWKVVLVNRKAAGANILGGSGLRNPSIADRDSLIIHDKRDRRVSGRNQAGVPFDEGKFLGSNVYLGELRTDAAGRLLVLGGRGRSEGIPVNPGGPVPTLGSFANNNRWFDDVADGPVTASVTVAGQHRRILLRASAE
jgi:hypothetical protein